MKFISEAESAALISHKMAYKAVREAFVAALSPQTDSFPVVRGHGSNPDNVFNIKSAATLELAGLKVGSFWSGNPERGLPRHNSLILLFDQEIGKIDSAIEAGTVNAYRTAAADAVAADLLAKTQASTLAIFGTGNQARYECAALARIRPLHTILVIGRDERKAQAMADELIEKGLEAKVSDARNACEAADIIVTATPARAPLFEADWVRPGTHVVSMGSDAAGKQELPPALFRRARLFCDFPAQARVIGDFQHAEPDAVLTAIGDVITGASPGRLSEDEITVFDSSGLSVQDLYIGRCLLAAHAARNP